MINKNNETRQVYNQLVELLSLKQFTHLMGGDMSFVSKAKRAMAVSKSKQVHELAKRIMALSGETV